MPDIKSYYPNALEGDAYTTRCVTKLKQEFGFEFDKTILATSVCSDEVIETATNFREYVLMEEPFNLGGLAGFPFTGITGFNAFAGHIPDEGYAIIFYGPHIGFSESNQAGKIVRRGQAHETSCCGALVGVVNQFSSDNSAGPDRELDYQQWMLSEKLNDLKSNMNSSDKPLIETTDLMYKQIRQRIRKLLDKTKDQFKGKKVALIGGIIINTDSGLPDWFEERELDVHTF